MFTGRNFEPETGLYFYRARHYQPKLGRFLQTDPLGYLRETNLYTYCWNNPLLFKDPFGLDWWETWAELADVRAAREQWRQWDIPVVSKVMDFMAGMVQFAQDDAQVMGYHGITSRKGMWALTSFTFNSFLMISAHPAVGKGVGNLMVKGAARLLPAGGLNLGKYVLVARFKEVAGKAYTAIEPIWVGIEKVVQGAAQGQGIIHAGVAPAYGGAHIGLNFLANTHIYLSHIRVGAQTELFTLPFGGSFIYRGIKGQFEYHGRTDYGKPDP
jgi:RHS repeat-associated protein